MEGRDVFILGAGFSRAISAAMPTLNDLSNLNPEWRSKPTFEKSEPLYRMGNDYEAWLSRLAVSQPHRSASENLRARQLYLEQVDLLVEMIVDRQRSAQQSAIPDWLHDLVCHWNEHKSVVMTFNYDTLVEGAVESLSASEGLSDSLPSWSLPVIWPESMTNSLPADSSKSFRLLKLHGSVNWFWDPEGGSGTLVRAANVGAFGDPSIVLRRATRGIDGRESFVIPPLAAKATLQGEPRFRAQWRLASQAIHGASRVFVLGFSFPATDWGVSGFLVESIRSSIVKVKVAVMPNDEATVRERLEATGVHNVQMIEHSLDGPIPSVVELFRREAVASTRRLLKRLVENNARANAEVFVKSLEGLAPIDLMNAHLVEGVLQIGIGNFTGALQLSGPNSHPGALTAETLLRLLRQAKSVVIDAPDGRRRPLVSADFLQGVDPQNTIGRDYVALKVGASVR